MEREEPLSRLFASRADKFASAAIAAKPSFAPGLAGFSRFYGTLAAQQLAIENDECRSQWLDDEIQQNAWVNEGGSEPVRDR